MAIFKCKMCGGTLEFAEGATVGVCDSCGTRQTLPRAADDLTANLFNRANNLRLKCEFDKAAALYEKIVEQDDANAEAHWGIVLCKYGIEYVEDPKTHTRVPTCHRTLYEAVSTDADYLAAVDYGDAAQQTLYENEARAIDRIQKNILSIVKNEKPFDVFLCYKETDENGKRTVDSALANDIYYQLTGEGFKVFFAAITLEDKLGQEYEPYIFAALHSARVMLAIGTKPEYFSSVWVKNEWSRFLALMKTDRSKLLIPCYRDMDPYDLPEEFAHLQAQDMGKIGFINDLSRGIKKVCSSGSGKAPVRETVVVPAGNVNTAPLLKRAFLFLEDGEWDEADAYCEKVLDQDPENAQAYLGKLMAELRVHREEDLADCEQPFDGSNNYQKAVRFGGEKVAAALGGYLTHIVERNEQARVTELYNKALFTMETAKSETDYKTAAELFGYLEDYLDSPVRAAQCLEKAEICRKDGIYQFAKQAMDTTYRYATDELEQALSLFQKIPGYRDADDLAEACQNRILEIKEEKEREQINATARTKKANIGIFAILSLVILLVFFILLFNVFLPNAKYNTAVDLYNAGKYEEAIALFEALGEYEDSPWQITKCKQDAKYNEGLKLYNAGEYEKAITVFASLDGYKDSENQIKKCEIAIKDPQYNAAIALIDQGDFINAYETLISLNRYKDSAEKAKEIIVKYKIAKIRSASVGDIVFFGSYEQDNNASNGKEEIEWLVLAKETNKVFLISKYALDCQRYNSSYTSVTWETCSLRIWLNNTFISAAFSFEERNSIISSVISVYTGHNTIDKLFLLNISEANRFFNSDKERQCEGTVYCYAQGAYKADNGNCWWWLRSFGDSSNYTADVFSGGSTYDLGPHVNDNDGGVRPAMWIDLS